MKNITKRNIIMALTKALCLFATIAVCVAGDRLELENNIVDKVLSGYHKDLRPTGNNATLVSANTYIRNILSVCEKSHKWKVQLTFRQEWNDPRLAYSTETYPSYKFLTLTSQKDIWTPDLFFSNEIEATYHNVPQSNTLVRVHPNGDVMLSIRLTLLLTCPGYGSQPGELTCPIYVASYAYNTDEVVLQWKETNPVQIDSKIALDDYNVREVTTGASESQTAIGKFGKVAAKVHLTRKKCSA